VRDGYHAAAFPGGYHDYAFLPLYPMLVKLLALPVPGWEALVAVVLSNVLFGIAILLLVRLTEPLFGRAVAYRSAGILALFPFSAAVSMAYAESLFMVLMLGAFLAVERQRAVAAGVLLALATLTRLQGVVLVLPLAWILWERAGRSRPRASWLALLLGPLAAAGAFAWVVWLTGDVSAYAAAQGGWGRLGLGGDPQGSLAAGFTGAAALVHAIDFAVLLSATFLFVFVRRDRIPAAYVSVPALFVVMVFVSGSIQSIGRLLLPAFPYSWMLAGRRGTLGRAWPAISGVLLFAVSALMFSGWFVP
jgi:Gpi18-like mannosyltransferase